MKVCFTLFFFCCGISPRQVSSELLKSASGAMQSQVIGAITLYRKVLDTDPKTWEGVT